jgi:hypothetical protein
MPTFAPNQHTLDERTREAWTAYRDQIADLGGREYDAAEAASWDRLQEALREIEADRATPPTSGDDGA